LPEPVARFPRVTSSSSLIEAARVPSGMAEKTPDPSRVGGPSNSLRQPVLPRSTPGRVDGRIEVGMPAGVSTTGVGASAGGKVREISNLELPSHLLILNLTSVPTRGVIIFR
jgi:hypothetical protein